MKTWPKKNIKKHLEKREVSTKGSHEVLLQRLLAVIEDDYEAHKEAFAAEQEQLAEELAEREAALAHLGKLNKKLTKLKAPGLRKQLEKRGLSTKGKKTALLERLADALEQEMEGKLEQQKRIKAEEARIAEIAGEQEAADEAYNTFVKAFKKMKKSAVENELKQRNVDASGDQDEMKLQLMEIIDAEKQAADEERRLSSMDEEEKLAHEVQLQQEQEERARIEAEEALEEQRLAEMNEFDKMAMEEDSAFDTMKDQVEHMPKKNIKKNLEKRGLSTKGTHDVLMKRLIKAIESDHDAHREQSDVDRVAWEAEQEQLAEEQAEREAALAHLGKVNKKFTKLKAPGLRKQLEKRGLSTKGKKTVLLERLADALEKEMEGKLEQQKRIKAEEAKIAEIAEEQEAADAEFTAFKKAVKKMKKPALMKELKARELEFKGSQEELSGRLLEAVKAEKDAADELRREESMTEEETLAREVAEQEAEEERERIEAEEALAEQEAARLLEEEEEAMDPELVTFRRLKARVSDMTKKDLKKHLVNRGLSGKGTHDDLLARMLGAIEADLAVHREQSEAERLEMDEDQVRVDEELAVRKAAIAHLKKMDARLAKMKAPKLREELASRGLDTSGKKTELIERLAAFLEGEQGDLKVLEARQRAADEEHSAFVREISEMKRADLMVHLKQRELDIKGEHKELMNRLLKAVKIEKLEADKKRQQPLSESDKEFERLKHNARQMPKKNLKQHLEKRGLGTKGTQEVMLQRLLDSIEEEQVAHREQTAAEEEEEGARLEEEQAKRDEAMGKLNKMNKKYAKLKPPELREELAKRGLKTAGKRTVLLERLATALETEMEDDLARDGTETVDIVAEQQKADAAYNGLVQSVVKMKKPALMMELKKRRLDMKGSPDELSVRLMQAIENEKHEADAERKRSWMTSDDVAEEAKRELEAEMEQERLAAEQAELAQLAEEEVQEQERQLQEKIQRRDLLTAERQIAAALTAGLDDLAADLERAARKQGAIRAKGKLDIPTDKETREQHRLEEERLDLEIEASERAQAIEQKLRKRLKTIDKMPKKRVKDHLKELQLSTKGTHDELIARYKKVVESETAEEIEQHQAEWEEEAARVEEEIEEKMQAQKHLKKMNTKYAKMKAPQLRKELSKRGLDTTGQKAELMERLAQFLEEQHSTQDDSGSQADELHLQFDLQQRKADIAFQTFVDAIPVMKKPALMKELKQRSKEIKGTHKECTARLLKTVQKEKLLADEARQNERLLAVADAEARRKQEEEALELQAQIEQEQLEREQLMEEEAALEAEEEEASTERAIQERRRRLDELVAIRQITEALESGETKLAKDLEKVARKQGAIQGKGKFEIPEKKTKEKHRLEEKRLDREIEAEERELEIAQKLRKRMKTIDKMPKKRVKDHLKELKLSTKGTHDDLIARYKKAVESETAEEIEQHQAEWAEEEARVEEENAEKMKALKHLEKMNKKYAKLKAPRLRYELSKRGLDTTGKKAELIERLAQYLEAEYDDQHNQLPIEEQERLLLEQQEQEERERLEAEEAAAALVAEEEEAEKQRVLQEKKRRRDELAAERQISDAHASGLASLAKDLEKSARKKGTIKSKGKVIIPDMKTREQHRLEEERLDREIAAEERAGEIAQQLRQRLKTIDKMPKKRVKGHLKELKLSTKGTHDDLIARYKMAVESETAEEIEQHQAEWEEEESRVEEENAEKIKALKHLTKMNKKYANMKAPQLRKELEKRGLSSEGKKAVLMERLAQYLEDDYTLNHNKTEKQIQAEEDAVMAEQHRLEVEAEEAALLAEEEEEEKQRLLDEKKARRDELTAERQISVAHASGLADLAADLENSAKKKGKIKKKGKVDIPDKKTLEAHRLEEERLDREIEVEELGLQAAKQLRKRMKTIDKMPKKRVKGHLKELKLSTKGTHDDLIARYKQAVESEMAEEIERHQAEWELEAARVDEENAEKMKALKHLTKMNKKYATMKAPQLRKELARRDLDTTGKKADLMERLAQFLEAEYDEVHNKVPLTAEELLAIEKEEEEQRLLAEAIAAEEEQARLEAEEAAAALQAEEDAEKQRVLDEKKRRRDELAAERQISAAHASGLAGLAADLEKSAKKTGKIKKKAKLDAPDKKTIEQHRLEEERLDREIAAEEREIEIAKKLRKRMETIDEMPKKRVKGHLKELKLSTKGTHDELIARYKVVVETETAEEIEQHQAEWADEEARVAEENAEKMKALKHLRKLNLRYAKMKAPQLRKELETRGLSSEGKKAVLMERLAQHLEEDHDYKFNRTVEEIQAEAEKLLADQRRIEAEEEEAALLAAEEEAERQRLFEEKKARRDELAALRQVSDAHASGLADLARDLEKSAKKKGVISKGKLDVPDKKTLEQHRIEEERLDREIAAEEREQKIATKMEKRMLTIDKMPKKRVKEHLKELGKSTNGSHDDLIKRYKKAVKTETADQIEQHQAEWAEEEARVEEEIAEKMKALKHLTKMNKKYATMKAP
eukprot:COSAG01_NODE_1842_length_9076_cov_4.748246_1_plen_2502_part_10